MQLAADEISITLDTETIVLRPSLRAALRIERAFGGFDMAIKAILEENVSALALIIKESAEDHTNFPALLDRLGTRPLRLTTGQLTGPILHHIYNLAGIDLSAPMPTEDVAPSRTDWAHHHEHLFQIATGWLGWSPSDAWHATPAEIMSAYRGRLEMLKAVFGGSEETKPDTSDMSLDDKFKMALASFPTKVVRRSSKQGRAA